MTSNRPNQIWQTADFRPAPPGWKVVCLFEKNRVIYPIAGWLIQDRRLYDSDNDRMIPDDVPVDRRVIPGICIREYGWMVEPIDEGSERDEFTWKILAPGDPEPNEAEEAEEQARRAELRRQRRG